MHKLSEQDLFTLLWNLVKGHLPINQLVEVYAFVPEFREEIAKLLEKRDVVISLSRDKSTVLFHRGMDKLPFKTIKKIPEQIPDFSVFKEI
jgi:hypothetical protein